MATANTPSLSAARRSRLLPANLWYLVGIRRRDATSAVPRRRAQRRGAERLQRGRPSGRYPAQPAGAAPRGRRLPPVLRALPAPYCRWMSQENIEVVRRLFVGFDREDWAAALELFDPAVEWSSTEGIYHGPEGVLNSLVEW